VRLWKRVRRFRVVGCGAFRLGFDGGLGGESSIGWIGAAELDITQENAGDYLRFFMTFLRTGEGESFKVIESLSGYALVNDEKPEQRKPEDMRLVWRERRR
jgi:hypothetical protein